MQLKIYQIKDIENTDYAFRSYNEQKFNFADYKEVFSLDFPECFEPTSEIDVCNFYWERLNADRCSPEHLQEYKYEGWSPSVSDVFFINNRYFYCDPFGWKEVLINNEENLSNPT